MLETKYNYSNLPLLEVKVLTISPHRLLVQLPDGRKGIIPKREWTWDRSVRNTKPAFGVNQKVLAIALPDKQHVNRTVLSIREIENPWKNISDHLQPGQVVVGEVVNTQKSAAFVQIRKGVTAVMWAKDIPLFKDQIPSDLLNIGDLVSVQIMKMDVKQRTMEVSMLLPMMAAEDNLERQKQWLMDHFKPRLQAKQEQFLPIEKEILNKTSKKYTTPPVRFIRSVLIVDDQAEHAEIVGGLLQEEYECDLIYASNQQEAIDLFGQNKNVDLALIDLNLGEQENGTTVARLLLQVNPRLPLIFISTNTLTEENIVALEADTGRFFPFVEKPLDWKDHQTGDLELLSTIQDLQKGVFIKQKRKNSTDPLEMELIERLENISLLRASLEDQLHHALHDLARTSIIEFLLLLEFHQEEKKFELLAAHPEEKISWLRGGVDGLYFSPVRDVMESGETFYLGATQEDAEWLEIRNLFPELDFRTCYCLPIKMPDVESRYVLLALDKGSDLSWHSILNIRTTAAYLGIMLERDRFERHIDEQHELIDLGKMLGDVVHELNNYLVPLRSSVDNLDHFLKKKGTDAFITDFKNRIAPEIQNMYELVRSYNRLANYKLGDVDVHEIVKKVYQKLIIQARKANVHLALDLYENPPMVKALPLRLEQTLTNVVLNAIQQVEANNEQLAQLNQYRHKSEALVPRRVVLISTCLAGDGDHYCIAVMDSGPGVPYPLREKIFYPNFTTRKGGQGRGLDISRNQVKAMKGRLDWVESICLWGSMFSLIFSVEKTNTYE